MASDGARRGRPWLLLALLGAASFVLGYQLLRSSSTNQLPLNDFVQFWAAGRLNAAGENPYDPVRMEQLERLAGRDADVLMMWNPPWVLPFLMPFGQLTPSLAYLLWMVLLVTATGLAAAITWRTYGGSSTQVGAALLLAFTFVPTFVAMLLAQISPLPLLGASLFLLAKRRGRWFSAGAAAALLALKPHLTYLFWPALLFWSIRRQNWRILVGALAAGIGLVLVAFACNPSVMGQYVEFFTTRPPAQYRSPTLGTLLRLAIDPENFRLQYLSLVPGFAWLAWYWRRHANDWDWGDALPALLLASLVTSAYGAWPYDLVLLLVPLLHLAVHRPEARVTAAYWVVNLTAGVMVVRFVNFVWFAWLAPALAIVYVVGLARLRRDRPADGEAVHGESPETDEEGRYAGKEATP